MTLKRLEECSSIVLQLLRLLRGTLRGVINK